MRDMAAAGCRGIFLGVEPGSDRVLAQSMKIGIRIVDEVGRQLLQLEGPRGGFGFFHIGKSGHRDASRRKTGNVAMLVARMSKAI